MRRRLHVEGRGLWEKTVAYTSACDAHLENPSEVAKTAHQVGCVVGLVFFVFCFFLFVFLLSRDRDSRAIAGTNTTASVCGSRCFVSPSASYLRKICSGGQLHLRMRSTQWRPPGKSALPPPPGHRFKRAGRMARVPPVPTTTTRVVAVSFCKIKSQPRMLTVSSLPRTYGTVPNIAC